MKKFLWFLAGIIIATSATAFAVSTFTDQNSFDDWYRDSVLEMANLGVINGYSDGSFGPSNYVTRAELAVMLDRFNSKIGISENGGMTETQFEEKIQTLLNNLSDFEDPDLPRYYEVMLIMAASDMKEIDGVPAAYTNGLLTEVEDFDFPEGYTVYAQMGIEIPHYVHYVGPQVVSDYMIDVDIWYGSF